MAPPDDYAAARTSMVRWQLKRRGIKSARVLDAMERVPREQFVAPGSESEAYADRALAIQCGQTISQPYIVALMTEALELSGDERVLEIGTGSGYQAAVLAELSAKVYSIERHETLSKQAEERLSRLSYTNVHLKVGDGAPGWRSEAPFDRLIITAAARHCPDELWEQLVDGGIAVGPFGAGGSQILQVFRKIGQQKQITSLTACRFVPLVSDRSES